MEDGTFEACKGFFRDSGGDGDYSNNENITMTICSPNESPLTVIFYSVDIENNFDQLTVYDGPDATGAVLLNLTGEQEDVEVCSESGCLTFFFTSDGSVTPSGWEAQIFCADLAVCWFLMNS